MTKIKIKAISEVGKNALKQHVDETKKLSLKNRLVFRMVGTQAVSSEDPYTVDLILKVFVSNPKFIEATTFEIEKALKNNGATKGEDYIFEVE